LNGDEIIVVMLCLIIVAGAALMIMAMVNRRKMREMVHRERIAMIQQGLIPSPEANPAVFEATSGLVRRRESAAGVRFRTAGVLLIGIGVGLMLLITFTVGEPGVGFGVGGAWAALGGASLLNYFLMTRADPEELDGPTTWPAPPRRPEPPQNIGP
jgi:hypothetical protein